LMLVQEFPTDMKNKGMKINSKLIKSINSGGDQIEGRKNFKDSMTFNIQCSTVFMANDLPAYSTGDVLEKCIQITSTTQFKSQAFIDEQLKSAAGNADLIAYRMKSLKVADENLRHNVKTEAYANALIHIIIDNYKTSPVLVIKDDLIEGDQDVKLDECVFTNYKITGNSKHFTSNEELKDFAIECDCSLKKLKAQIKGMGSVTDGWGGANNKQKGIRGIVNRTVFEAEELKLKQIEAVSLLVKFAIAAADREKFKQHLIKQEKEKKRLEKHIEDHNRIFNKNVIVAQ